MDLARCVDLERIAISGWGVNCLKQDLQDWKKGRLEGWTLHRLNCDFCDSMMDRIGGIYRIGLAISGQQLVVGVVRIAFPVRMCDESHDYKRVMRREAAFPPTE